jgi:isoleucyl-tRNA synthetase
VIHQDQTLLNEMKKLEEIIKIELNVKEIEYMTNESDFVILSAKPNLPVLGKKLGKEMGLFRSIIEKLSSAEVQKIESGEKVIINNVEFDASEILVLRNARPGTQAVTNKLITIDMDCTLDQELIDEGLAREMVNRIQKTRKDSNFNVADRIELQVYTTPELANVFQKYQSYISSETLMVKATLSSSKLSGSIDHEIDQGPFEVLAKKV